MKRFVILFLFVAMLFTSCELASVDGDGNNGGGNSDSANDRVETLMLYGMGPVSSSGDNVTKIALCFKYDDEGRVEHISHIAFGENGAREMITQTINYETSPATITSTIEKMVLNTSSNEVIFEKSNGTSGAASFNGLNCLTSLSYGDMFDCAIAYSSANGRMEYYRGGRGNVVQFVWDGNNVVSAAGCNLTYLDKLATWYGFDWLLLFFNGYNEHNALLSALNTNGGLHSDYLPNTISVNGNSQKINYAFDNKGRLSTVKFGDQTIEFYLYESEGRDFGFKWDPHIDDSAEK